MTTTDPQVQHRTNADRHMVHAFIDPEPHAKAEQMAWELACSMTALVQILFEDIERLAPHVPDFARRARAIDQERTSRRYRRRAQ